MKITVGTAYYGALDREFEACVAMLNHEHPDVRTVGVFDCSYIDQAKSVIATKHMDDSDVVIIVDHDMIFEPKAIIDLAASAVEADAVVGAAYCTRAHSEGHGRIAGYAAPPMTFFGGGGLVPATALAGGFLALPCSVLHRLLNAFNWPLFETSQTAMAYPFFACMQTMEEGVGKWWGEDLSFCKRLDQIGEKKFLDTRIRVGHKGRYIYHIEDAIMAVPRMKSFEIPAKEES